MYSTTFVNSFVFKEVNYKIRHGSVIKGLCGHNYIMYLQKGRAVITTDTKTFYPEPGDILRIPGYRVFCKCDKIIFDARPDLSLKFKGSSVFFCYKTKKSLKCG